MGTRVAAALVALALAVAIPAAGGDRDQEQHERLFGGRAYIALRDGSSATGAIYGLVGEFPQLLLVLTDGRRFGKTCVSFCARHSAAHATLKNFFASSPSVNTPNTFRKTSFSVAS